MKAYIKLSTLQYPCHEGDIRLEYPEIPESLTGETFPCPSTYAFVNPVERPSYNFHSEACALKQPQQIDGEWFTTWEVRDLTEEELDYIETQNLKINGLTVERI